MPNLLRDPFSTGDQPSTPSGSGDDAVIIPMYRTATTPPNMTPRDLAPYQIAPPPIDIPYGWRMTETSAGWVLQHEPAEWSVIARCVEGRRAGRPLEAIAAELATEDAPIWNERARDYGVAARWHKERVRRLVHRYAPELQGTTGRRGSPMRNRSRAGLDYRADFEQMLEAAERD